MLELVAELADGVNIVGILGGFLDFIAEGSDAAIHAARGDEIIVAPYLIEQGIPCQHPAGVFEEMTQEAIFLGGQLDGFALTGQAAGGGIQDAPKVYTVVSGWRLQQRKGFARARRVTEKD
jgi:hypothetical protein